MSKKRDIQLAETNQRLLNCCTEIICKLAKDPEARVDDVIAHMGNIDTSRRTQIREKYRTMRNACDRFDGRA